MRSVIRTRTSLRAASSEQGRGRETHARICQSSHSCISFSRGRSCSPPNSSYVFGTSSIERARTRTRAKVSSAYTICLLIRDKAKQAVDSFELDQASLTSPSLGSRFQLLCARIPRSRETTSTYPFPTRRVEAEGRCTDQWTQKILMTVK